MTFQVQRIGESYGVLFTAEQMRLAGLHEGIEVDVQPHAALQGPSPQHVSLQQGMNAYKQTEPAWAAVYDELAK